jgi:hypothetical protein
VLQIVVLVVVEVLQVFQVVLEVQVLVVKV